MSARRCIRYVVTLADAQIAGRTITWSVIAANARDAREMAEARGTLVRGPERVNLADANAMPGWERIVITRG